MLELNVIRTQPEEVKKRLAIKQFNRPELVDQVIKLDESRRSIQKSLDDILNKSNTLSKDIGLLFRNGKRDEAEKLKAETVTLKESSNQLKVEFQEVETQLHNTLVLLPNLPHHLVPEGKGETDNVVTKTVGDIPKLAGEAIPHWELAEKYNIISWKLGTKIAGAGFPVYLGKGARLQRALISFFLDQAGDAGYQEVLPPHLVNEESAFATGQLPDKEGQMYHCADDNYFLIPTAEVPITNIYRGDILAEKDLPIKMAGYTPCFRREAGSYGKDVRGLNRVHQFDKIEIVQIQHPDKSYDTLNSMVAHVEGILQKLNLPYRILALCGGDATFASALTYDFEVYSAAQERWLEVSSVSNFETFQSNRMKLRFREEETKKTRLAHTLNGSALALARIVACLLENNQSPEGIHIPEVLRPYTGFDIIS